MQKSYLSKALNWLFCWLFLTLSSLIQAQIKVLGTVFDSKQGYLFEMNYAFQKPYKDMANRFGNNSAIGLNVNYKTRSNWMFGFGYQWIFSSAVREVNMLDSIQGASGQVIDKNGLFSVVRFYERGHTGYLNVGRIFPVAAKNENSGFMAQAGLGFMVHKIYIFSSKTEIPQLTEEYKKGYDRLSGGLSLKQFVGYTHLDPRRRVNISVGIEFQEAFTRSLRSYDFDKRSKDNTKRIDILIGPKIGITIPVYTKKKTDEEFFTN
jgi:hypothetical protein